MANKFKEGDWVEVLGTDRIKKQWNKSAIGFQFEITNKEIYRVDGEVVYLDKKNIFCTNYIASDLKLIKKPKEMATKKKTTGIVPEEGMYFTANKGRKKIRGYIFDIQYSWGQTVVLVGKDFDDPCDKSDCNFPTELRVGWEDKDCFEEQLKECGITNFVVCIDKRQKAIIDGDQLPKFRDWKVVLESGNLIFGCGSVETSVKNAKLFAEIFCDFGEPTTINNYWLTQEGEETELEDYYQTRKYLEENYTAGQIAVFYNVLEQIFKSGEIEIYDLECSEMKELLKKF